jgi:hypothetical protein
VGLMNYKLYMIDVDDGYDVDQCRKYHNLKPLQERVCNCLRCNIKFTSHGLHNRLCYFCRREITRQYESPPGFEHLSMAKFYVSHSRKRYYLKLKKLGRKIEEEILSDVSHQ